MTEKQLARRLHLIKLRQQWLRGRNGHGRRQPAPIEPPAEAADETVEVLTGDETLDVLPDPD